MKEITGRHVLIFTVAAFAVIVGVNLTMAFQAVRTFPGLEVRNSYVASQSFDADRAAQEALGWRVAPAYRDGLLTLSFTQGESGPPAEVAEMTALVGRATTTQDDMVPVFVERDGVFTAALDLGPGNWNIRLQAQAPDGTAFRQRLPLYVPEARAAGGQ